MSPAIPAHRQCDRNAIISAIRQSLAESWAEHDGYLRSRREPLRAEQANEHAGRLIMASAVCRAIGADADTINREAARLARRSSS